jgi:hypothetical protein
MVVTPLISLILFPSEVERSGILLASSNDVTIYVQGSNTHSYCRLSSKNDTACESRPKHYHLCGDLIGFNSLWKESDLGTLDIVDQSLFGKKTITPAMSCYYRLMNLLPHSPVSLSLLRQLLLPLKLLPKMGRVAH